MIPASVGILVGLVAIVALLVLEDRERNTDGLPMTEEEPGEEFTDWADWNWPNKDDRDDWRWPS